MNLLPQPVLITGFMGSGKTSVARSLAHLLDCPALDLDELITEREGRSIREIISQDGEDVFRLAETRALRQALVEGRASVIALGGGTWALEKNRALIEQHQALVVWLDAPFELCWRRIIASSDERPLAPDRTTAHRLYVERQAHYQRAHLRVEVCEGKAVESLAAEIAEVSRLSDESSGQWKLL